MEQALNSTAVTTTRQAFLFGPVWDFALLGGGSLFALLMIRFLLDAENRIDSFAATLMLANIVNHPHFAHSYQIFYRDFRAKLTTYPKDLRWRYWISGVAVPVLLAAFFALAIVWESSRILGAAANAMFFFVGWHYVKQGYGMAMVDAVLKKAFYSEVEKKHLLHNAYATWIFSWILINHLATCSTPRYFDIPYFTFPVPWQVLAIAAAGCVLTSFRVVFTLRRRVVSGSPMAWNGVLAYIVSLYAWLLIRDPLVLLWIPLFHSVQYLTVVWRYELNRTSTMPSRIRPVLRFTFFLACGLGLGYLGFWGLPNWLDSNVDYDRKIFGASLFLYVSWIFINVHHYFLDTVMWRKGNPDVQAHLFTRDT